MFSHKRHRDESRDAIVTVGVLAAVIMATKGCLRLRRTMSKVGNAAEQVASVGETVKEPLDVVNQVVDATVNPRRSAGRR